MSFVAADKRRPSTTPTARGIVSERTAEFVLVPLLLRTLSPAYVDCVAIRFWMTREGRRDTKGWEKAPVRLLAVFARRPKVVTGDPWRIVVKVNEELFDYARRAAAVGVPTLAGVPLATSVAGLARCRAAWFHLDPSQPACSQILHLSPSGTIVEPIMSSGCAVPLDRAALVNVASKATPMSWRDATEHLRSLKRATGRQLWAWWAAYQPFHVVVPQDGLESASAS